MLTIDSKLSGSLYGLCIRAADRFLNDQGFESTIVDIESAAHNIPVHPDILCAELLLQGLLPA